MTRQKNYSQLKEGKKKLLDEEFKTLLMKILTELGKELT